METEAAIHDRHRFIGIEHGVCRCSCSRTWFDPDMDCPAMLYELGEAAHHRLDDDGGPAR